ncbi:hypothetical protein KMW28_10195 [Flammeovirga yaeyamensis]|uniref:Uncharacterized protein n=1 Tax=Flammeovirga yaeyamensis TaxID=367791 RepID=A0AAX1MXP6_9BACT|nr:hypothetical protein [Flammeovirga yaeyamensis]MBB3696477.1 hypothetical protein [Flammeovirga yaeyamensis]NMF35155.1 hypothetical protein [Flammeovirga yaeyamensis]QWG00025.1 hypothetical protein KMW28_10195 [Flammeovirga yaeyamensis]
MNQFELEYKDAKKVVYQKLPKRLLILLMIIVIISNIFIRKLLDLQVNPWIIVTAVSMSIFISGTLIIIDIKKSIRKLANSFYQVESNQLILNFKEGDKIIIDLKNLDKIIFKKHGLIIRTFNQKYFLSNKISNSSELFQQIKKVLA